MASPASDSRAVQEPDPRIATAGLDIRPVVERPRSGLSGAAITGMAVVAGLGLFGILEARRERATAPATASVARDDAMAAAPPPLYIPPMPPMVGPPTTPIIPIREVAPPGRTVSPPAVVAVTAPAYENSAPLSPVSQSPRQAPRSVSGQALVIDTSAPSMSAQQETQAAAEGNGGAAKRPGLSTTRARAAMFANRSTTVPQGTLIPAVLETAFDSTSPGFARALVQKDIHGFDGTRVLIPRGSRLIGEYGAETTQGQNRAVILWSRLIRPDGVTIAIGSPAADTVGRGGVKADVNSHFLARFSGAILQSALDVGVNLAARNSRSPVIVALPGSSSAVTAAVTARSTDIAPTLRVPAGRGASVFVARDLDFTEAEVGR